MRKIHRALRAAASIAALAALLLATSANASTITYSTDSPATGFNGGASLTLDASGAGVPATLAFIPNAAITTGIPSNVNFGNFTLVCPTCTTQAGMTGATFDPFTFDLVIVDITDGNAAGTFVGSSTGGSIFSNAGEITINWAPLILGPGTTNAAPGSNFGNTFFTTTVFTAIVAPNSGCPGAIHGSGIRQRSPRALGDRAPRQRDSGPWSDPA